MGKDRRTEEKVWSGWEDVDRGVALTGGLCDETG